MYLSFHFVFILSFFYSSHLVLSSAKKRSNTRIGNIHSPVGEFDFRTMFFVVLWVRARPFAFFLSSFRPTMCTTHFVGSCLFSLKRTTRDTSSFACTHMCAPVTVCPRGFPPQDKKKNEFRLFFARALSQVTRAHIPNRFLSNSGRVPSDGFFHFSNLIFR
jgi:hypothetical protein